MYANVYKVVGDEFELGFRHQDLWGWKIAFAFFFGEVGTGFFFFSAIYDYMPGMAIGWVMAAVLKPIALFMHLGVPIRFWRAIMGLRNSWISRGVFFTIFFTGFGFIHMVNQYYAIVSGPLATLIYGVAMLGCLGVMIYLGFVLSYSPAISLWNSGLMPIISLIYGLLGGVTLFILFGYNTFLANNPETLNMLKALELGLVLFCLVSILCFLHGAAYGSDAGRKSVQLLLKEKFAKWFIPFVILIGLVLTGLLAYIGPITFVVLLLIAIAELIGDIGLKILLFKAGTFEPSISHSRF
jgi:formate-dependent nitrite reductase membrane component NrfD